MLPIHSRHIAVSPWPAWLLLVLLNSGCVWWEANSHNQMTQARQLVEQAGVAQAANDYEQARRLLEAAVKANPKDGDAHRQLASIHLIMDQPSEAADHLRLLTRLNPDDSTAWLQLARAQLQMQRVAEAATSVNEAISGEPTRIEAWLLKAHIDTLEGRTQDALNSYHRLLSLQPEHSQARLLAAELMLANNQPEQAAALVRHVTQARRVAPPDIARANWNLGVAYGAQARWSDAVEQLSLAVSRRHPVDTDGWYRLAYARLHAGQFLEVREELQRILQAEPQHSGARAMLALLQQPNGVVQAGFQPTQAVQSAHLPVPSGW